MKFFYVDDTIMEILSKTITLFLLYLAHQIN